MRIERIVVDGFSRQDAQAESISLDLNDGLNVVAANHPTVNQELADLVGHVLYGARLTNNPRLALDQPSTFHEVAGYVDVSSRQGQFRFRRHHERVDRGSFTEPRLTVAALENQTADSQTAAQLLGGLDADIAARLLVLHSTDRSQLDWLLSEKLATQIQRLERNQSPRTTLHTDSTSWNRNLLNQRDNLTAQIETLLADKRRLSEELERALAELEIDQQRIAANVAEAQRELDRVIAELAEMESQLRYHELAELVGRTTDESHHADQQPALEELDGEIERWRRSLAELEAREARVRAELAQLHPDDASPRLPLADQRAAVAIAGRLVADLDSEVARFARPGDSRDCICQHTHARLHPLIDTLGQQVDKLSALIAQYDRALEFEQLKSEAQHLARAQVELRATIDHLLDRRQSHMRTSRARVHETLNPAADDRHDLLVRLQRQRSEMASAIEADQRRLDEFEARRQRLLHDRAGLMNDAALAKLRSQLDEVTRRLSTANPSMSTGPMSLAPWRASDILAKLTDGRLLEVRLTRGGREATVVDRHGNIQPTASQGDSDRRLVAISLQLAAVAAASHWGTRLPLVVADPFAHLSDVESSILALVLHDFARAGHQLIAFTNSNAAIDRWRTAGQPVTNLGDYSRSVSQPPIVRIAVPVEPEIVKKTETHTETYALSPEDAIERFGVFGADTGRVFADIGIETVGQLMEADAVAIAGSLDRTGISAAVVELWQTHLMLLSYVPDLNLDDAQVLTGADVWSIDQLCDWTVDELYQAVSKYLQGPQGSRHQSRYSNFSHEQAERWINSARRGRNRWSQSRYASRWSNRRRSSRSISNRRSSGSKRKPRQQNRVRATRVGSSKARKRKSLKFRLSRTSAIVDAPSIGPKTAKRLAKVGIRTVADFLAADCEAIAGELDVRHIDAEKLVAWQHQAQLMCRVPELLARDTQLLVGSGFTTPEDIASANPSDLLEFAKSFVATPEGARVLRGADDPTLERATKWVSWANQRRALEVA